MPSLKDLRVRIASVKSTRKITSAMKMVAASKLKRAQQAAEAARPYAERMEKMLGALAASVAGQAGASPMLVGTGKAATHLLLVVTSDRGLCGGFNASIARMVRQRIAKLSGEGKTVKLITVGRKGRDQLRRDFGSLFVDSYENVGRKGLSFAEADAIALRIIQMFEAGEFDICEVAYSRFKSVISQEPTVQQLVPFPIEAPAEAKDEAGEVKALYEFEPSDEEILAELLPRNLAIQIYRALLESFASEQGARTSAMDNATRNAGDMLDGLTVSYNRTRQAMITKELIEIISGAEAL